MNNTSILIIEDEAQIRKLLTITLQSNDYKVIEACTGKEGISVVASHSPDLVLLDLGLPDQSGHEVLRHIREWFGKPIIIVSVQNSEEDIIKALDSGANDYLLKPFRTGELLARIRSSLRRTSNDSDNAVVKFEDLQVDFVSRTVKKNITILLS